MICISEPTPWGTAQSINFDRLFSEDCSIPKSWSFETLLPDLVFKLEMGCQLATTVIME
jgi:hypothetical protein